ncbi:MAG: dihydroxyacetone kinase phosphoryl donor subunit DhaM [Actinomycetota bacterium]|nr:dihydroxyacetone kinase phosphoryl donor subunit DhaM [Actinomycetota bacterium]
MSVGLVLVSHSAALAEGTAALAAQMAPSVTIESAGGGGDGGIGTSFDLISAALAKADTGDGVVILYDLGSALLTTETSIEFAEPAKAARWRIVDAPLVEGAVAAAVDAEGGGSLESVVAAAVHAAGSWAADRQRGSGAAPAESEPKGQPTIKDVDVVNPLGLHARPAAELARALAGTSATVRIGRPAGPAVDLRSVLGVVGLALRGGDTVRISVWGPDGTMVLGRLVALIGGGFGEAGDSAPVRTGAVSGVAGDPHISGGTLRATPGAAGLAIGPLVRLDVLPDDLPATAGAPEVGVDATTALTHLDAAIAAAAKHLAGQGEFGQAHAALIADPALREQAAQQLAGGPARAWWRTVTVVAKHLENSSDELVASRGVDLREAGLAVLAELGVRIDRIGPAVVGKVVVATDLGPAEVPELVRHGATAVVLAGSSTTAHAVIVARGLGLPLVLRAGSALDGLAAGTNLVVDGDVGTVRVDPPPEAAAAARSSIDQRRTDATALRAAAAAPVHWSDGRQILVAANIGSVADATAAVENGADAVGLLRTELLVLDRPSFPTEDEQTADLATIFAELGDRPVVVRVLDAGGDKPVATLEVSPEHNGFLGVRGLRYLLQHPDLLRTQLRAICRAAVGHRMSVMAPMVTVRAEAEAFRLAVNDAVAALVKDGVAHARPEQVGIMVEVPAAALDAGQFAGVVDFFSVGSNDLTSYTMAADRTEPGVADLLDPGAPAIGRLLDLLCAAADCAGIPVAVCGEMAGMGEYATALVDRGVSELSMAPARIPQIKAQLRAANRDRA